MTEIEGLRFDLENTRAEVANLRCRLEVLNLTAATLGRYVSERTAERDEARSVSSALRDRVEALAAALRDVLGYWDDVQGKLLPEAWPIPYRAQKEINSARALLASPGTDHEDRQP